jgi:hypothetical protein
MYRIIDKKCSGKTSRLLLLAKENNGIVVCKSPESMREKAYQYGITGIDFVSYYEYTDYLGGYGNSTFTNKPIFIDEVELFLQMFDNNIQGYTISED